MTAAPTQPAPPGRAVQHSALGSACSLIFFALLLVSYYVYVNVINRAPADVYVARRGPAVSTVYGTVTINAKNALTLFAQNAGYLHDDPPWVPPYESQGQHVKKDQLMATVVDENAQRQVNQAQTDYESAVSRQTIGPASAGAAQIGGGSGCCLQQTAHAGAVPQCHRARPRRTKSTASKSP